MPATLLPEPPVVAARPQPRPRLDHGGGSPPERGGGDGDGGDGGGGDGDGGGLPFHPGKLAMAFFIFSLSILFLVTLASTLMLRRGAQTWPPPGAAPLPRIVWANTVALLASSAWLRRGVAAIARGQSRVLVHALAGTTVLGTLFLLGQLAAWRTVLAAGEGMASGPHGVIFYWLTGLHGAHVVGGLVFLGACLVQARRGRFTAERRLGVELCEIYWHFLGVVWIVLVLTLSWALA